VEALKCKNVVQVERQAVGVEMRDGAIEVSPISLP
jgi:hypothetical protein